METLQVALGRRSYPIYIGGGLLEQAEELLRPLGVGRWAIVCDDTVAALYGAPLARRTGWPLVTFPAGEGSKSLEEYDRLCRRLVQLGLTRSDGIVALGGGVTGDLAGFAAATLLRGLGKHHKRGSRQQVKRRDGIGTLPRHHTTGIHSMPRLNSGRNTTGKRLVAHDASIDLHAFGIAHKLRRRI